MILIIPHLKQDVALLKDQPEFVLTQIFSEGKVPFKLVVLEEDVNLKNKLAEFHLGGIPLWNVYDTIQMAEGYTGLPLSFNELDLADYGEPFFKDDDILFFKNERKVAQIRLYNHIEIREFYHFLNDGVIQKDCYDARGFISSQVWFSTDYQLIKKRWFTPWGAKVMEMDSSGIVMISLEFQPQFNKLIYSSIWEIVIEKYQQTFGDQQILITSIGEEHEEHPVWFLPHRQLVGLVSRLNLTDKSLERIKQVTKLVCSNTFIGEKVAPYINHDVLKVIPPYPTSFILGQSGEMSDKIIYLYVRDFSEELLRQIFHILMPLLVEDDEKKIVLEDQEIDKFGMQKIVENWVWDYFSIDVTSRSFQFYSRSLASQQFSTEAEWVDYLSDQVEELIDDEYLHIFYQAQQLINRVEYMEKHLSEVFNTARIFLDLSKDGNFKRQTDAISYGIPQVTIANSDFISEGVNGFVNNDLLDLPWQIVYFVDDLQMWNRALIENVKLIQTLSASELVQEWQEVLEDDQ